MKKAENVVLVIGIILNSLYILLQLAGFVYQCFTILPQMGFDNLKYSVYNYFYPSLITIALMLLPVILLVLNLKNKAGKVLPIITAVMSGVVSLLIFFASVTPTIPQYLIYSKLQIIETVWVYALNAVTSGSFLLFCGFGLLTIGSIMSLIKSKE